jgi:diguanylate cyclase (GGDEF)-like protein
MFFNRTPARAGQDEADGGRQAAADAVSAVDMVSPLLDAIGQLLGLYQQGVFDMPDCSVDDAKGELDCWRRHAVIGTRSPDEEEDSAPRAAHERDWRGVTRHFGEHRRAEKQFVERALADLRDALWTCVEHSYQLLLSEQLATDASATQVNRVRDALDQLETGVIKDEITQAMRALDEIAATQRATQRSVYGQLAERIEQLGAQLEDARKASETDALTGLGNRLAFDRTMARQLHLHALSGNPLTVVSIDLDGLKAINDDLGHAVGDEALVAVGKVLHRVFLRDNDIICRLGGDEFAVVLANTTDALATRLLLRLSDGVANTPWAHAETGYPLHVSAGTAQWTPGESVEAWFARADAAMYAQKRQSRPTPPAAPSLS